MRGSSSPMQTQRSSSDQGFAAEQKEYLQGFFAGVAATRSLPFVAHTVDGKITHLPAEGFANAAVPPKEEAVFGTPVSELCEQEIWKLEQNGLDIWDRLLEHAQQDKFPDKTDNFFFVTTAYSMLRRHKTHSCSGAASRPANLLPLSCAAWLASRKIGAAVMPI